MDFVELKITVSPEWADILIAELAEIGYESFAEFDEGVLAYVPKSQFSEQSWAGIVEKYSAAAAISYTFSAMPRRNWNEEWEKNYPPIVVDGQCVVRATFHEIAETYPYQIVINPKMSFGTGHHHTTTLMLEQQLRLDHAGKHVLDAGSGTGILAIMACLRGAAAVDAYDIDEWAVTNALENAELNHCPHIAVQQGTIATVRLADAYHLVLANINRNILLEEMPLYAARLAPGGTLLLSGFYEHDAEEIKARAQPLGLLPQGQWVRQQWACLRLDRQA